MFLLLCVVGIHCYTKRIFNHLFDLWYLDNKKNEVGQWFDPIINRRLIWQTLTGNRPNRYATIRAMMTAIQQLEPNRLYTVDTHLVKGLQLLEKRGELKIRRIEYHQSRYLWELLLHQSPAWFIRQLRKDNVKEDSDICKQFYTVAFEKL